MVPKLRLKIGFSLLILLSILSSSCTSKPGDNNSSSTPTVDNTPPAVSIISPTNAQEIGGSYILTGSVSDSGSGVAQVFAALDDNPFIQATISGNTWSVNMSTAVYGKHTNSYYAIDKAWNVSVTNMIVVERTAVPSILITAPATGTMTNNSSAILSGTSSVDLPYSVLSVEVQQNGGSWLPASGTSSWSITAVLQAGTNTFKARAVSSCGKTNITADWLVIMDAIAPVLTITSPAANTNVKSASFMVSGTASDNLTGVTKVYLALNGGSYQALSNATAWSTNLVLSNNSNTISVYCTDGAGNSSLTNVKNLNLYVWKAVGSPAFSSGNVMYTKIAIDPSGVPYVIFQDLSGGINKASVMKYTNSAWSYVGSSQFSAGRAYLTSIAIDPSGVPYIAYEDVDNGYKAVVMKYTGSWNVVGTSGFSSGRADSISLAIDPSGTPYVSFVDFGSNTNAFVMKLNGSNWSNISGSGFPSTNGYNSSIKISQSGTAYLLFTDKTASNYCTVMKYNGSSWTNAGNTGFAPSAGPVMAVDQTSNVYVAFNNPSALSYTKCMKYNGLTWSDYGGPDTFNYDPGAYLSIAVDPSGIPYVAMGDSAYGNEAWVMAASYTSYGWYFYDVGKRKFSTGSAYYTSIAFDPYGTPYVVYEDIANGGKATVMKYAP